MTHHQSHKPRRNLLSFQEWLEQRDKQHEPLIVEFRTPEPSRSRPRTTIPRSKLLRDVIQIVRQKNGH